MRLRIAAVLCGALLTANVAHAAPYGSAGCGLGSVVFGDQEGPIQIIALTLNGILANQLFGITTGTLNCGEAAVEGLNGEAKVYIEGNREVLAKDISRGQGDTIVGLSAIAGCQDSAKVGAALQKNYEVIFPSAQVESQQVTDAILDTLRSDKSLACQQVI